MGAPLHGATGRAHIDRLRFAFEAFEAFEALETMRLPAYTGSAWRGLLGRCLRQTVCVTRQPRCDGCLPLRTCVYSTFFESPAASPATCPLSWSASGPRWPTA